MTRKEFLDSFFSNRGVSYWFDFERYRNGALIRLTVHVHKEGRFVVEASSFILDPRIVQRTIMFDDDVDADGFLKTFASKLGVTREKCKELELLYQWAEKPVISW